MGEAEQNGSAEDVSDYDSGIMSDINDALGVSCKLSSTIVQGILARPESIMLPHLHIRAF